MQPQDITTTNGRQFVFLCKSGRAPTGRQKLFHAVTPNCRMALCATEPGPGSDWAEPPGDHLTCPICRTRLDRLAS
jgi:hypothetical protein